MKTLLRKISDVLLFLLGFNCNIRKESVDSGICDFSGQGRNSYGN